MRAIVRVALPFNHARARALALALGREDGPPRTDPGVQVLATDESVLWGTAAPAFA